MLEARKIILKLLTIHVLISAWIGISECVDPFSAFFALGSATAAGFNRAVCATGLVECCSEAYVKKDAEGLRNDLNKKLYGQHIVVSTVSNAIRAHVTDPNPSKALVLSFHGWTGVGKSFVSRLISKNLYTRGGQSSFVHNFYSDVHFKHESKVEEYKDWIHSWIYGNVSRCERSLFVFDELDHMPEGWIDVLVPFLGHNTNVDGVDFRKSIFIFLSVVGGELITDAVLQQWKASKTRESIQQRDLENALMKSAYNKINGLKSSRIIRRELIDYFIPFLPLERQHVKLCVRDEFKRRNFTSTESDIEEVLNELNWFPDDTKLFSTSGCKKVTHKVVHYMN